MSRFLYWQSLKKIILAPDAFKGTMSAVKICSIMEGVIKRYFPDAEVLKIPLADGGEGTIECFIQAIGGEKVELSVKGPYCEAVNAFYAVLSNGETAVVEMAQAAGLPLVGDRKNPLLTTTYGVGQLIRHAVENSCKKIIIGLGGSCTNDGGVGMAAASGIRFYDSKGYVFVPTSGTLDKIARIDTSEQMAELDQCDIVALTDVDNPLHGIQGAACIFGPQKGADRNMVEVLDNNLQHLSERIKSDLGKEVANLPGSGAAGGMGAGVVAFFGGRLAPGIETVLDTLDFNSLLENADIILTGEGKIDKQSLRGKVIVGVARRAKLKSGRMTDHYLRNGGKRLWQRTQRKQRWRHPVPYWTLFLCRKATLAESLKRGWVWRNENSVSAGSSTEWWQWVGSTCCILVWCPSC